MTLLEKIQAEFAACLEMLESALKRRQLEG